MFRFKGLMAASGLCVIAFFSFGPKFEGRSDYQQLASEKFANVVLVADDESSRAFAYLIFPFGEAANPYDEGLAHYVEHLAWYSALKGREQTEAHSNAWTNAYTTGYWMEVDPADLETDLARLASVAEPIALDAQFALEERNIVLREYDLRIAEWPLYSVGREMDVALYGEGGLSRSVIGSPEVIAAFDLATAKELHRQSHRLAEATLLVFGDVNPSDLTHAMSAIDDGKGMGASLPDRPLIGDAAGTDSAEVTMRGLPQDTYIYRKLLPMAACDGPTSCPVLAQLAENALDSTLPGGLAGPLRYDAFIARTYFFDIKTVADTYIEIIFEAVPDKGVSLDELGRAFEATLMATLESGLSAETFERVKARSLSDFDSLLDHQWPNQNREFLLEVLSENSVPFGLTEQREAFEAVDPNELNAFLKSLSRNGRTVVRLVSTER